MSINIGKVEVRKLRDTAHAVPMASFISSQGDMKDEDSNQLELSPLSNLWPYLTFRHHEAELSLSMENEDSF